MPYEWIEGRNGSRRLTRVDASRVVARLEHTDEPAAAPEGGDAEMAIAAPDPAVAAPADAPEATQAGETRTPSKGLASKSPTKRTRRKASK